MSYRFVHAGILSVCLTAAACVHTRPPAESDSAIDSSIYVEPRIVAGGGPMRLQTRSSRPFRGTIEIPIDANGRAEVYAIRVIGRMDDVMKRSLQEWLAQTRFIPAKRDGVPVPGVFRMTFR